MSKSTVKFSLETEDQQKEKYRFVCKECSKETLHKIIASYNEKGYEDCGRGNSVDWNTENQIIQCLGCETVSFRVVSTCSEDYDHDDDGNTCYVEDIKYYPGRSENLKAFTSYLLPKNVQHIYRETILAIENEQNILAGIGIRALIETICNELNASGKNLYKKINWLKEESIVTKEGMEALHKLRVLGNDAAHEVKAHNIQQLSIAIQIIEHMLEGTYIIPHKVSMAFT